MNTYTMNAGINAKLTTVEDDIEALTVGTGTLETDVESLILSVGALKTSVDALTVAYNGTTPTDTKLVDQALTVSGGATRALTMTDIDVAGAKMVAVQVHNKGASTTVTVNIFGKMAGLGYTVVPEITAVTLNATTTENDIIILTSVPYDLLKVVIDNADAANEALIDVVVRAFKPVSA